MYVTRSHHCAVDPRTGDGKRFFHREIDGSDEGILVVSTRTDGAVFGTHVRGVHNAYNFLREIRGGAFSNHHGDVGTDGEHFHSGVFPSDLTAACGRGAKYNLLSGASLHVIGRRSTWQRVCNVIRARDVVFTEGIGDGESDGIYARRVVLMPGVLQNGGVSVAEIPEPGLGRLDAQILKVNQSGAGFDLVGLEICDRGHGRIETLGGQVKCRRAVHYAFAAALIGAEAESSFGERPPNQAFVQSTIAQFIGHENGVPRIDETGAARLQFHAVGDQLHHHVVASRSVYDVGIIAVFVDKSPSEVPQHGGPYEADSVRDGQCTRGQVGVGVPVYRKRGVVGHRPDAVSVFGLSRRKSGHGTVSRIFGFQVHGHHNGVPIAPPLARLLVVLKASRLGRATGESIRKSVAVLVDDDAVVEARVFDGFTSRGRERGRHGFDALDGGNDVFSHALGHHHRRNENGSGFTTHVDDVARHVVHDDHRHRAVILRHLHFFHEGARSPSHNGYSAVEQAAVNGWGTQVQYVGRCVRRQTEFGRESLGGKSRAECGRRGYRIRAGYQGRLVNDQSLIVHVRGQP